jgi:hypothetical protein
MFDQVEQLVRLELANPASSVETERGFSRQRMQNENLNAKFHEPGASLRSFACPSAKAGFIGR